MTCVQKVIFLPLKSHLFLTKETRGSTERKLLFRNNLLIFERLNATLTMVSISSCTPEIIFSNSIRFYLHFVLFKD